MRFLAFLGTVFGIWFLFHLYVGWRLWPIAAIASPVGHRVMLIVLAAGYAFYPLGRILHHRGWTSLGAPLEYCGAAWMGLLVVLVSWLGLVDVVTLFGLVLKPWVHSLRLAAAAVSVVLAVVAWAWALAGPRTVELEVVLPNLPEEADGTVVVQLSDLHLGSLIGERRLRRVAEQIRSMGPDLVAVTGDLVDSDAGDVARLVPALREIDAPLGVYAVLGNHEYYAGAERSRKLMRDAGFTVLDDTAVEAVDGLWVAGVADMREGMSSGGLAAGLDTALTDVPDAVALILLQHRPGNENRALASGVGLMLNGHTHGGQIWPAHYLVRLSFPHYSGVRRVGEMTQLVCRGAGQWGPPMRLFAPSEIWCITLRSPAADG